MVALLGTSLNSGRMIYSAMEKTKDILLVRVRFFYGVELRETWNIVKITVGLFFRFY